MDGVKIFFAILLMLGALLGVTYIISKYLKSKKADEIKKAPLSPRRRIHELLCLQLFYKNVFSGYYFPVGYSKNGVALKYAQIDTVAITRGGVAVITVKEQTGRIECSDEVWTSTEGGVYSEFDDPTVTGEEKKDILARLIRHGRLENVPIYSIVVFTSPSAVLVQAPDNTVKSEELLEVTEQLNSQKALSISEMFAIKKLIDSEKKTKREVRSHMRKIYG